MLLWRHKVGINYLRCSAWITLLISGAILLFLTIYSWKSIAGGHIHMLSSQWDIQNDHYGLLPMIYGTLAVSFIALMIAIPIGISTSIFISEFIPKDLQLFLKGILEILAGIPSIVYGLVGVGVLNLWVAQWFELSTGRTLFSGGIILGIMVLPTIISLCHQSFEEVPKALKDSAKGLGLYPHEIFRRVVLPSASHQMVGAILLALGRALGETMAVMLIVGSIDRLPSPWFNVLQPGQTMTAKLGREIGESSFGTIHFSALISIGLFLFVLVLIISLLGQLWYQKKPKSNE